jgi:hypothetical protein
MARAMVLFERQSDGSWMPGTVLLATPKRLRGKCLPGSPDRDARLAMFVREALPPRISDFTEERGSFIDWVDSVDWALYNLANGHTVKPTRTVDELFQREVLDAVRVEALAESSASESRDQAPEVDGRPTTTSRRPNEMTISCAATCPGGKGGDRRPTEPSSLQLPALMSGTRLPFPDP